MISIIDRLFKGETPKKSELIQIIEGRDNNVDKFLLSKADAKRRQIYGNEVFARGLIEITNHCKNNCYYCGISAGNRKVERYRLTDEEILSCCKGGYALGFRSFVLQGGEDAEFTDARMCALIKNIKRDYPDCAVTLSLGEKSEESYRMLYDSGADRYLLRHETASSEHYSILHPKNLSFENRKNCLYTLKKIGFQVGAGFMVGSPKQTTENLADDLLFLYELQPHMVGIGPFIPHEDTVFRNEKPGSIRDTIVMLSLTRLLLPHTLLPSTTALGSIAMNGRSLGLRAGANVVMPNLSPVGKRKLYSLYNNKASLGAESAEGLEKLKVEIRQAGYKISFSRGDYK